MPDLLEEAKRLSEHLDRAAEIAEALDRAEFDSVPLTTLVSHLHVLKEDFPELVERVEQAEQALVDLHESLFIGSERGLSKEALGKMATFAKDAALAAHQREVEDG